MDNAANVVTISVDEYFDLRQKAEMNVQLMIRFEQLEARLGEFERRLWEVERKGEKG